MEPDEIGSGFWLIIYFKKREEKKIPEKISERSDGRESCTWKEILCSLLKDKPEKSEGRGKKIADSVNSAEVNGKDVFSEKDGRGVSFVLAVLGEEEEEEPPLPPHRPPLPSPTPSPAQRWQASDRRSARNSWPNYFNFFNKNNWVVF